MARVSLPRNQNNNPYLGIKREQVLALDVAQHCGYFSVHESGTWDFTKVPHKHHEHLSFREKLCELIEKYGIKLVTAEDLIYQPGRFNALKKLGEFRGVLLEVCQTYGLPKPEFVAPSAIKIIAADKGNAKKEAVMAGVKAKWNIDVVDDNHADAAACFFFTIKKYNIL
ncbi:MAG: crossover junction endodeoxyribonuclease RuvC [Bacteroidales bacterium]